MNVAADASRATAIGVTKVEISPREPFPMSGDPSRGIHASRGVSQRLKTEVLAIGSDQAGPSLVVTVDRLGIPDAMTEQFTARIKQRTGISRESLALGAAHAHSIPCPGTFPGPFEASRTR